MKKLNLPIIICLFLSVTGAAYFDKERAPYNYTINSSNGKYCFEMSGDSSGIAYKIIDSTNRKELWRTSGWYAFTTYISNDGKFLVRLGNWPRGSAPSEKDLAVAFYEDGVLLKEYSTRELIKNDSLVTPTVSHYMYMKGEPELKNCKFYLTTVDNINYVFNLKTGKIKKVK